MGQIAATYDLMPENTDIDLNAVIQNISGALPEGVRLLETKILPVAFGLMKVNAGFLIDDSDEEVGGKLEEALSSIEGIENIECVSNTVV
ncbi:MAG: translation elongation factor EF-1beta [Candidatus Methanomethylophilaceae archaeon]|jgi:elongation factor 1-beta|nr:translation elongation factor EF-1beta [Candidatus Methanomethylophilaceae archaeon]NLF33321.1 translation elongation factor EF-1beta [Thermoplasmatales archaeon]